MAVCWILCGPRPARYPGDRFWAGDDPGAVLARCESRPGGPGPAVALGYLFSNALTDTGFPGWQ